MQPVPPPPQPPQPAPQQPRPAPQQPQPAPQPQSAPYQTPYGGTQPRAAAAPAPSGYVPQAQNVPGNVATSQAAAATPVRSAPAQPPRNVTLRCPNCGGPVTSDAENCPTCGEALQGKIRLVRCRYCGKKGSSRLTICPHCGRALKPAPSRLLTIGLPVVLGALFLALFALQSDSGNPLRWAASGGRSAMAWVSAFSAGLDPQLEVLPAPEANAAVALPTARSGNVATGSDPGASNPADVSAIADGAALAGAAVVTAGEEIANVVQADTALTATTQASVPPAAAIPAETALPTEAPTGRQRADT